MRNIEGLVFINGLIRLEKKRKAVSDLNQRGKDVDLEW